MKLFEKLIDPKTLKILKILLNNRSNYFHLQKLSHDSNVPIATTFRIVKKLLKENILEQTTIQKTKLYRLKQAKELEKLLK